MIKSRTPELKLVVNVKGHITFQCRYIQLPNLGSQSSNWGHTGITRTAGAGRPGAGGRAAGPEAADVGRQSPPSVTPSPGSRARITMIDVSKP